MAISLNQIKFIRSLEQKKFRDMHGQFVIEGDTVVKHVLGHLPIQLIIGLPYWIDSNKQLLQQNNIAFEIVTEQELQRMSHFKQANQVLGLVNMPAKNNQVVDLIDDLTLVLDDISNPGNLGTIIRLADWFGISSVVCSTSCVDVYNPKVVQATMGSIASVQVVYTDVFDFLTHFKNEVPIYAAVLDGNDVYNEKLKSPSLLIIGNESRGVSPELNSFITKKIKIPSYSQNQTIVAESLNAGTATGILLAEFRRQQFHI